METKPASGPERIHWDVFKNLQIMGIVIGGLLVAAVLWTATQIRQDLESVNRSLARNSELLGGLEATLARQRQGEMNANAETLSHLALALKTLSELNLAQHSDPRLVPSPLSLGRPSTDGAPK